MCPINRSTDLNVLKEKEERPTITNPTGKSDLPGIDIFVSTADPDKEPPLVTAKTILSILATDYPVEKLACYVSDDGVVYLPLRPWLKQRVLLIYGFPSAVNMLLSPGILNHTSA